MKRGDRWYSERLGRDISLVRWGTFGTPVLVFPTAGGDAEEVERNGLVDACSELLAAGRVKLYSCDSTAGRALLESEGSPHHRMWLLNQYHHFVRSEVVPAIHADSGGHPLPVVTAGASIGAFNALAVLCRFPEVIRGAVCMSGTFDLQRFYEGQFGDDLYFASPVHFLEDLHGEQLDRLRERFVIFAMGEGEHENPGESWRAAHALGRKGIPNRVDAWGVGWEHDWPTWLRMLPQYLDELA